MIIERIKIQYRIHQALSQAKKLEPKVSNAAEEALKNLNKVFQKLEKFNQKHTFFSKIFHWIDRRFGFNPLSREIQRMEKFRPIHTPELKTPEGSVEVKLPAIPITIPNPETEPSDSSTADPQLKTPEASVEVIIPTVKPTESQEEDDSLTTKDIPEDTPEAKNKELEKAIQAFQSKYAVCFEIDQTFETKFQNALRQSTPEKRLNYLKILNTYLEKTEKWVPAETYLPIILEKPDSVLELIYFVEDVYEKRKELTPQKIDEEMDLYIEDVFDLGLYWLPDMDELLTKERVEAFLLNDNFEENSLQEYVESIYNETKEHDHFLNPYLESCLEQLKQNPQN